MAKKHRAPIIPIISRRTGPAPAAAAGPEGVLQSIIHQLRRGNYAAVQEQVAQLQKKQLDPSLARVARDLSAEAYFRAAMLSEQWAERLPALDAALQQTPDTPKLHFYRGITLWQLGRVVEGLPELDAAATHEPDRRSIAYLRALARAAAGQPWDTARLTPAEANTVRLVAQLVPRKPRAGAVTLTEPLLGKGLALWQALVAMREDVTAAPVDQLKTAAEQNMRKPISRILTYYRGVAAARAGDRNAARAAWLYAQGAGFAGPALAENLTALLREEAVELAQADRWQEVVNLLARLPQPITDRILAETGSLAYFHLGYEAARTGRWQIAAQHWRKANELSPNRYLAQNLALAEEALENWANAAEAWREMVRRRPRKEDHPDHLTDTQVAALWNHAADCYGHIGAEDEIETCLRNAVKNAPDDPALRMRLADMLLNQGRGDAAETQLKEVVTLEPQNTDALTRLGRLYADWWDRDPKAIWRQVLAINPAHPEAREALAEGYIKLVHGADTFSSYRLALEYPGKSAIQVLEIALQELPGHPRLVAELGIAHARAGQYKQAREQLLAAHRSAPQDVQLANTVVHELLHAKAGDAIAGIVPIIHQIPGLLPAFWFDQASMALECKFGDEWADFFIEEALKLIGQPWVDDTRAGLLVEAFEIAAGAKATALCDMVVQRIRAEVPTSGALEYIEAYRANFDKVDTRSALRLIREAIRLARKANDRGILRRAEAIEGLFKAGMGTPNFDIGRIMRDLFPEDF